MILRSIELENFGKFRGKNFELRRGMNLVIGPNEAGKSTFVEAIPAVLFGCRDVERYKPWGRNACAARLVFEGKGRTVEVRRDLLTDDVQLVERDDLYHTLAEFNGKVAVRGRGAVFQEYRDLLVRLLGIGDEDLFRATCFFGHRPQEWSGDELARKLRNLIGSGSGEGDYARILDDLLSEYFDLTRVNPWGRDKQRDRTLEELAKELAAREQAPPSGVAGSPAHPDGHIRELAAGIERDREEYAKGVRYIEQVRRRLQSAQASDAAETAKPKPAAETVVQSHSDLRSRLAAAGLPDNLPPELPEILAQAAEIRQELARLQQPFALLQQKEGRIGRVPWLLLGGLALLLALAGGGVAWLGFAPAWVVAVAGSGGLGLCGWGLWRQLQSNRAHTECLQERQRLEQQRSAAQARQATLGERCEALGLPASAVDLVRLQKQVEKHRDLLTQLWRQPGASGPAVPPSPPGQVDSPVAADLPADTAGAGASGELAELEQRLAKFAADLEIRESKLRELQATRPDNPGTGPVDRATLDGLRTRKAAVERRVAVLREAIELLAEAVDDFARSDLTRLVDEVSRLFGKLTRGRYREVRLDVDMHPELRVDERRWQPVERFSRGTVDALYLALRVALARVRGDGRSLPLMLDDPFAHLDQKRLAAALNMIDLAAAEGQLILLSHNQELARRAARERWHVVALDEELAGAEMEEDKDHAGQLHLL